MRHPHGSTVRDRIHTLAQALWTGGVVAIDLVETPARFRAPGFDRNQIGVIGRTVFAAFNRYEIGLAGFSLVTLPRAEHWRRAAVAVMGATALAQSLLLRPQMRVLGEQLDFEDRERTDPRSATFRRLHSAYVALDVVKLTAGVATVITPIRPHDARRR